MLPALSKDNKKAGLCFFAYLPTGAVLTKSLCFSFFFVPIKIREKDIGNRDYPGNRIFRFFNEFYFSKV